MRAEQLRVELYPRSQWEAMELGIALVRMHARAIWLPRRSYGWRRAPNRRKDRGQRRRKPKARFTRWTIRRIPTTTSCATGP